MTESLILIVLALLLIAGLEVAHRRNAGSWRPGFETRRDRDRGRLQEELRAIAQRDDDADAPAGPARVAAPRSAATDYRLVNRIAA
jgi:hypothetical protein